MVGGAYVASFAFWNGCSQSSNGLSMITIGGTVAIIGCKGGSSVTAGVGSRTGGVSSTSLIDAANSNSQAHCALVLTTGVNEGRLERRLKSSASSVVILSAVES